MLGRGEICGSGRHYFHNGGFGAVRLREPMVLGHEVSGPTSWDYHEFCALAW